MLALRAALVMVLALLMVRLQHRKFLHLYLLQEFHLDSAKDAEDVYSETMFV